MPCDDDSRGGGYDGFRHAHKRMTGWNQTTKSLTAALLLMMNVSGLADGGLSVIINNNTPENLLVTVYDLNAGPAVRALSEQKINGFATLTVGISADTSGIGRVSWAAMTVERDMRRCGHGDPATVNDGDTVNVSTDSDCGT